jgi:hypothetical protein
MGRLKNVEGVRDLWFRLASCEQRFRDITRIYGMPSRLRSTPSFSIRLRKVLGLSFKIAAAPAGRRRS